MTTTPNLGITHVLQSQTSKEVTINAALSALDDAGNNGTSHDLSAGNVTLTSAQFRAGIMFTTTGNAVSRDLTLPGSIQRRVFFIYNSGSATLNVKKGTTTLTLLAGKIMQAYTIADANTLVAMPISVAGLKLIELDGPTSYSATGGYAVQVNSGATAFEFVAKPFDLALFVPGTPLVGATMARLMIPRACVFPANFTGSYGYINTSPTATFPIDVKDAGTSIGTLSIDTGGTYTFTTVGGTSKSVSAGARLSFIAPTPVDLTAADFSFTLIGTRT